MRKIFALLFLFALLVPAQAQTLANGKTWRYQLLDGSGVMRECLPCGGPVYWIPINGSFDLVGTTNSQVFEVRNISFASDYSEKPDWRVTGTGSLRRAGGVTELTVDVTIQRVDATENVHLTNSAPEGTRIFPMLSLRADESPVTSIWVYRLRLYAAPLREVWFSTTEPFGDFSPGDLLSSAGRVVKRNSEITERLSLMEPADISLDALDIAPRGEIFFSSVTNAESFVNGLIGHGDLLSSGGRVVLQSSQLLAAFGVDDPEAGLDALQIKAEDEYYFSISKEVTRSTGAKIRRGDILSNKGQILRSEPSLMLRFQNPFTNSVGIDALYIWPNEEIWFSTETNFLSSIGEIDAGDIVSDQGYIALRNADLIGRLKAAGGINAGLDAMSLIADVAVSAAANQVVEITISPEGIDLRWESSARVFQLEKAIAIEGPWLPASDIILERAFHDATGGTAAFYRVRQW